MSAPLVNVRVDRNSPVPLYFQVAEQLTAAIDDGTLQPGDQFENEVALGQRLQLSRPTVRRAIQELVDKGLLVRRRGLGTHVASRKVHRRAELTSLYDDLARAERAPRTTVLSIERVEDERAARAMELAPNALLLAITRVRFAGDRPLAVMRNWLPPTLLDLDRQQLETTGLYAALRERGVRAVVAHQSIGARNPTPSERRLLQLRGSQPVLTLIRAAFGADGRPVEFGDHSYNAEGYQIDLMVDER